MQNRKIDTQKIDTRFEQVRERILANAAFFVANGFVEATWRTYRGHRLGPYFRVGCRQRRGRNALGTGAAPRPTSMYLGRSPELAARVGNLLDDLQQHTRCKRRCQELRRQVRRSLTAAKQELHRLLAERGALQTWFGRRFQTSGKKAHRTGGERVPGVVTPGYGAYRLRRTPSNQQRTSNIQHPTSNVQRRTSNVERPATIHLGG